MLRKIYVIILIAATLIFGIWYCTNFDYLNYKSNNTLSNEINWQNSYENNNNTIDKLNNLEENSIKDKININIASESELQSINGIGEILAERIVSYRNAHSSFKSLDELKNIDGIGDKLFDKIKKYLTV